MKVSSPFSLEIKNGHYARGKEIKVQSKGRPIEKEIWPGCFRASSNLGIEIPVLEALKFLQTVREPRDKLVFQCVAVQTEDGKALYCETYLEED